MPISSRLAGHRELRVAAFATASMLVAFAFSAAAPLWTLALGPIVLGVPHLLADVRYCVVRPGWHRRWSMLAAVGVPLLAGAIASEPAVSMAALVGAAAAARGPGRRRAVVSAVAIALSMGCTRWPYGSALVIVHAHNLVAIGLWLAWRGRHTRLHLVPLLAFAALSAVLWGWAPMPTLDASAPERLGLAEHLAELAPDLPPALGVRLVVLFCFAQAVHYAIWLRVIPEEDRDRPTPRSFGQTFAALRRELGAPVLVAAAVAMSILAAWAVFDLALARASYLRFATFHVTLELAAAALLFIERREAPPKKKVQR
jgi:hypothetical protein